MNNRSRKRNKFKINRWIEYNWKNKKIHKLEILKNAKNINSFSSMITLYNTSNNGITLQLNTNDFLAGYIYQLDEVSFYLKNSDKSFKFKYISKNGNYIKNDKVVNNYIFNSKDELLKVDLNKSIFPEWTYNSGARIVGHPTINTHNEKELAKLIFTNGFDNGLTFSKLFNYLNFEVPKTNKIYETNFIQNKAKNIYFNSWSKENDKLTLKEKWIDFLTDRIINAFLIKGKEEINNSGDSIFLSKFPGFKFSKWTFNNSNLTYTTNDLKNRIYLSAISLGNSNLHRDNIYNIDNYNNLPILGGNNLHEKN
ncbi:hypothetical protein [Mycoplasma sp. CSL7503-lung]|uniref:hypothetical protein n=1 Tax=Mycoplasma sp. CSL7503-lung TaxID=536372 RepID=UPI0021D06458|nr:hypothetical protein [Mycoplasma sp. CSL7503-lung]MCU4706778.1 hypothetical protein [Mycoplasma sp. CSL7503-lung]